MYKPIRDYGIIGNMRTVALVSKDASIDYFCYPRVDSPSLFASILDDEKGGYFSIKPITEFKSDHRYIEDTNILRCRFKTNKGGIAYLLDFMPVSEKLNKKEPLFSQIYRMIHVTKGDLTFKLSLYPSPMYATTSAHITVCHNVFSIQYMAQTLSLVTDADVIKVTKKENGILIEVRILEGNKATFLLGGGSLSVKDINPQAYRQTRMYWKKWVEKARFRYNLGCYKNYVKRSMLLLKLLTYEPTRAVVAAATFGLPEKMGGQRNWDYRFSWLRDSSFTLKALFSLGYLDEAEQFIQWLQEIYYRYTEKGLQILYTIDGSTELKETVLSHLDGYRNSKPVRVGNAAWQQKQLDIYGEVMDTMLRLSDYAGRIDEKLWPFLRHTCDLVVLKWREKDAGIWEMRSSNLSFIYSKVMCWVALSRGILIAKRYGFEANLTRFENEAKIIKEEILKRGYDHRIESFVQAYENQTLDSSNLCIRLMGFLPMQDVRIQQTISMIQKNLFKNGFLKRYNGEDGLAGGGGAFLLCNFWLVESLALSGKIKQAEDVLQKTLKASNDLALFSEEYDPENKIMLGNFPQAFTHIGLINAVFALARAQYKIKNSRQKRPSLLGFLKKIIPIPIVLNDQKIVEKEKVNTKIIS